MNFKNILITGGAGFVGNNLAINLKQNYSNVQIVAFDNLKRRGSELNISRLKSKGVEFVHGDIRCLEDIYSCGPFDLIIDCSAEPSVYAGINGSPQSVINTNLVGTINCAEAARINNAAILYLSTSRVYPIEELNSLNWLESTTRFEWCKNKNLIGFSSHGISENFEMHGARSIYGATKLASEIILQEYAYTFEMPIIINRCGIIAGPWQMGKVDQGVVALWVFSHLFKKNLNYIGFGGKGKQVRDVLHVSDLFDIVVKQLGKQDVWDGRVYNVGGGNCISTSLLELTRLCNDATGNKIQISAIEDTSSVDLRIYISDARKAQKDFSWKPMKSVGDIIVDILSWVQSNRSILKNVLLQ